jgi:mRNA-degrading endonuclease YafQ of YafQ-DinJ toxin-antitoxin module
MRISRIYYSKIFIEQFKRLPEELKLLTVKKIELFKDNPLHPSLRLLMLKGKLINLWSVSITSKHRLIFKRQENGDILLISAGKHDIYKCL